MSPRPRCAAESRRRFLRTAVSSAGLAVVGCATAGGAKRSGAPGDEHEAEVTPGEDLMQEHGVLERVLLIYDEAARRIDTGDRFDPALVAGAAGVIRPFIEEYHEQNEEHFVFPRLEAAQRERALVGVLRTQHERGREVTAEIIRLANDGSDQAQLGRALRSFARMYRPHAAREDTVLFPAFRSVIGDAAYRELGEQFEEQEHAHLGEHGFENAVFEVARLETALVIEDLAQFTPR